MVDTNVKWAVEHDLIRDLKVEEGFRSTPYRDTTNNLTIGFGHNLSGGRLLTQEERDKLFDGADDLSLNGINKWLHDHPISEETALLILRNDIVVTEVDARIIYGDRWNTLPKDIKVSVLDMLFNLGLNKYLKFKKHIKAINDGDYEEAAKQVIKSLAYTQAPHRYKKIHDRILNVHRVKDCRKGEFKDDAHFWG